MSSTRVVCRPAIAPGFALAGLASIAADDAVGAAARLDELANRSDVGVVLLEDALWRGIPDEVRRRFEASPTPVVVPFPGPSWVPRPPAEAYVVEMLRQAIGYRVRLR